MIVKQRARAGSVDQMDLVGDVKDCDCILFVDDMIDTSGTLCKASEVLVANGARHFFAFGSQGLLSGPETNVLPSPNKSRPPHKPRTSVHAITCPGRTHPTKNMYEWAIHTVPSIILVLYSVLPEITSYHINNNCSSNTGSIPDYYGGITHEACVP
jgi:hypothetical protein